MTVFNIPKASTPEKQKQFDDLIYFLAERSAATARGEGPGPAMTAEQEAIQLEMLAAHSRNAKMTDEQAIEVLKDFAASGEPDSEESLKVQEEMAFINLQALLERNFKVDGLRAVLQTCEDAVNKAREVNEECQENEDLEMMDYRFAISRAIINEVTIPGNMLLNDIEKAGGLKAMGIDALPIDKN